MYNLNLSLTCLSLSPCGNLLALSGTSKTDSNLQELDLFHIPEKLLTKSKAQEGLLNKRDFAFHSGIRLVSPDSIDQVSS